MFLNGYALFLLVISQGFALGSDCNEAAENVCEKYWDDLVKDQSVIYHNECLQVQPSCLIAIVQKSEQAFKTPEDSAVFWSGDQMETAQKWAAGQNPRKFTLEQTAGGRVLDSLKLFDKKDYDWTGGEAAKTWDAASLHFANKANGEVSVFADSQPVIGPNGTKRTWWRVEAPTLKANHAVTYLAFYCQSNKMCKELDQNVFKVDYEYNCQKGC